MTRSEHGVDMSGAFADIALGGPSGQGFWDTTNRRLFMFDHALGGFPISTGERGIKSAATPRYICDNFRDAAVDTAIWTLNSGTDAQAVDPAILATSQIGECNLVTGNVGSGMAADGSSMVSALDIEAEEGEINLVGQIKLSAITTVWFFFGLTDLVTLEAPVTLSTTTFTTNATDACGIMFDTAATTDTIRAVGVANNVDATHVDTTIAPVAATYMDVRIRVSTVGKMDVWLDGVWRGAVSSAVTPSVNLGVILAADARTTASRTLTSNLIGMM